MRDVSRETKRVEGRRWGQSTMEFSFAAIVLVLLIYGLVQSVRWVIMDSAQRRYLHEKGLADVTGTMTVANQLNPQAQQVYYPDLEYRGPFRANF